MEIYKFVPFLKSVIWGGDKIKALKGIDSDQQCVGESWELSGVPGHESIVKDGPEAGLSLSELIRRHGIDLVGEDIWKRFGTTFPLLVKIIDAKSDLSVQVHPNDELAKQRHNSLGKTEMWYIMHAEPDAKIYAGLSKSITPDDYTRLVAENHIMDVIASHDAKEGDVYFLPAGRIHAIGAGNLLAEIQETSDITYRVYDFDRRDANGQPRELHTELAKDAIDYTVYPEYKGFQGPLHKVADTQPLVECQYFNTYKINLNGQTQIADADSFTIVMCLEGQCKLTADQAHPVDLRAGETVLVPASFHNIAAMGHALILYVNISK